MATVVPPSPTDPKVKEIDDLADTQGMSDIELQLIDVLEGRQPKIPAKAAKAVEPEEPVTPEATPEPTPTDEPPAVEAAPAEPVANPEMDALRTELAAAKEGSAKAQALQAQLDARDKAEPIKIAPDASNPLAHVFTHEALEAEVAQAGKWVDWCENHPEGGTVKDPNGKTVEWSAQEVQSMKSSQNAILRSSYSRGLYVMKYESEREIAKSNFPTIFDSSSPDYSRRMELAKEYPHLSDKPNFLSVIGKIIEGEKAVAARKQAAPVVVKPVVVPARKVVPVSARGVSAPGGVRSTPKDPDAEYNAAVKSGNLALANNILMSQLTKSKTGDE